jgi:dipeptidyl aminopeptidase/acylaminoacyl peptidase
VALPELPQGIIGRLLFSNDSQHLGLTLNRPTSPGDVYSIDLNERSLTQWTVSEVGGLARDEFVEPELVHYPTFDAVDGVRRQIPAFVFRPAGPGPHPVVINIHGGPESQYRPFFSTNTQSLVRELGAAVIAPNVRGSHGYGKTYVKLDNGALREDSVKDIGALLDWVAAQPDLDSDRVMVIGGSYGGYMVLAAIVHYADRLAAGVERVGISNFVTFLENTQSYRRDLRRAEYGDERIPEMRALLESISPLNHVDAITRPLMVAQGFNDPRVPASESAQLVAALNDRDVPVWYIVAMDEGHGFRKKSNRDYQSAATWLFMERFLLDPP